ncbi:MAG: hypothetical protein PHE52_02295 [Candidatus Pacebacteria bacterium]|nr:hypothetical protein [Candidatus Paceibacterota bacterium]
MFAELIGDFSLAEIFGRIKYMDKLSKVLGIGRYFLGLAFFAILFWVFPKLLNQPVLSTALGYFTFPFVILSVPIIILGLYFIIVSKTRWKLDVILILLAVVCFNGLRGLYQGMVPQGENQGESQLENIVGDAELRVTILTENQTPVAGVEVDVGEGPGKPPEGGSIDTNEQGMAIFSIKPGNYVIYFNTYKFPANLEQPTGGQVPIAVEAGQINQKTIILKSK